jgi:hypothetical protein
MKTTKPFCEPSYIKITLKGKSLKYSDYMKQVIWLLFLLTQKSITK